MSQSLGGAYYELSVNSQKFDQGLKNAQSGVQGFSSAVTGMLGTLGIGVSMTAIIGALKSSEQAYLDQVAANERLAAVLRATGEASGFTASELENYAGELQASTTFSDDAISNMMAKLATFKSVSGDVFKRATEAALDLSEAGFGSIEGASVMLGKALENPAKGIMALARAGVTFTDEEKKKIKALQESGDLYGAQVMILKAVEGQVGGVARAAAKTDAGKFKQLNNAIGELQERVGAAMVPILNVFRESLVAAWTVAANIADVFVRLNKATGGLAAVLVVGAINGFLIASAFTAASASGLTFATVMKTIDLVMKATPWGIAITAIVTMLALVAYLAAKFIEWVASLEKVKAAIQVFQDRMLLAFESLKAAWNALWAGFIAVVNAVGAQLAEYFGYTWTDIAAGIEDFVAGALDVISAFILDAAEWIQVIAENWGTVMGIMAAAWNYTVGYLIDTLMHIPSAFGHAFMMALDVVMGFASSAIGVMQGFFMALVQMFAEIPNIIMGALRMEPIENVVVPSLQRVGQAFINNSRGWMQTADNWFNAAADHQREIFNVKLSPETQAAAKKMGDLFGDLADKKAALESGRGDLLGKLKSKDEKDKQQKKKEEQAAAAAAQAPGGFIGFEELAKKMQEAMVKDDTQKKMHGLMEQDQAVQEEQRKLLEQIAGNTGASSQPAVATE